jgi:hypothetical protein
MTLNHVFFSVACTAYFLLAVKFLEEPDMVSEHGDSYNKYKERVPMYCPFTGGSARPEPSIKMDQQDTVKREGTYGSIPQT